MEAIRSALISLFYKDGLEPIVKELHQQGVTLYSTGGTRTFIENLGIPVVPVEDVTGFPSILGGRVKTLHPGVFGGILARRDNETDREEMVRHKLPYYDLVMVDLYPFTETVSKGGTESEIIEKIDIGGVSLIRAAAKNHRHTLIISSKDQYSEFSRILSEQKGQFTYEQRRKYATEAFRTTAEYDTAIGNWFSGKQSYPLRYGENPHQSAVFNGNLEELFDKIQGKELSYNNLLDIDAAVNLIDDFPISEGVTFAILKHNNACGIATRPDTASAWEAALAADPVSAFGGILICNGEIDSVSAKMIDQLFFEVIIAPAYTAEALEILSSKKNRIILRRMDAALCSKTIRTVLNGELVQDKDLHTEQISDFRTVTKTAPTDAELHDLAIAARIVKHTKSNAIVLVKNGQLLASGTGQTSRVDALKQAIAKARSFSFDLSGAVMASDAFFPFPDCVEIAHEAGITAAVQPGGSVKDQLSIDYCDQAGMSMVFTGFRHFKH